MYSSLSQANIKIIFEGGSYEFRIINSSKWFWENTLYARRY